MAQQLKSITQFYGGISPNSKSGLVGSGRFMRYMDIYRDADTLTPNPRPLLNSASNVQALIKWIVNASPYSGDLWGYDEEGNLYRSDRTFWNLERSGATIGFDAAGQGLEVYENALYYATSDTIGRGIPLNLGSGSIVWDDNFIDTLDLDIDNSQTTSGQTYTCPTTITENSANSLFFTPTHTPITEIQVELGTKGTGWMDIIVHNSNNETVAAKEVANADLPASGNYSFFFDTPWDATLGQEYHFHILSQNGNATVVTGTTANLSTVDYIMYFGILFGNDDFHPMIKHTNGVTGTLVIGNNEYMAVWDGTTYNPNQIRIEPGYSIRGWARENEYIVAFCWRQDTDDTEDAQLFYWDGIAPYYNYSKPINLGAPLAMISSKNRLFSVLGQEGNFTLGTEPFRTIQPSPKVGRGNFVDLLPGGISSWQNKIHMGLSSDDPDFEAGIYVFGNQSDRAITYESVSTEVINYSYGISTGSVNNNVRIGAVFGAGNDLFVAWDDNGTFGVDIISKFNDPNPTSSWESLIIDEVSPGKSAPQQQKEALTLTVAFTALPEGATVTPKYRIDRDDAWTLGTGEQVGAQGDKIAVLPINKRYREIEIGFDVTSDEEYPLILSLNLLYDNLSGERLEGMRI